MADHFYQNKKHEKKKESMQCKSHHVDISRIGYAIKIWQF